MDASADESYNYVIAELRDIRNKVELINQKITEIEVMLKIMVKIVKVVAIGLAAVFGINLSGIA